MKLTLLSQLPCLSPMKLLLHHNQKIPQFTLEKRKDSTLSEQKKGETQMEDKLSSH